MKSIQQVTVTNKPEILKVPFQIPLKMRISTCLHPNTLLGASSERRFSFQEYYLFSLSISSLHREMNSSECVERYLPYQYNGYSHKQRHTYTRAHTHTPAHTHWRKNAKTTNWMLQI